MITADALAREIGCTLADLADLGTVPVALRPNDVFYRGRADDLRAAWSERTGVDYTK